MAVKIRLKRTGAKKQPSYRVVVADSRSPRDGRFIQEIGYYNPQANPKLLKIDEEAAKYWLSKGAQPTDTVRSLLKRLGILEDSKKAKAKAEPAAGEAKVEIAGEEVKAETVAAEAKADVDAVAMEAEAAVEAGEEGLLAAEADAEQELEAEDLAGAAKASEAISEDEEK